MSLSETLESCRGGSIFRGIIYLHVVHSTPKVGDVG
jgi:hypothetical protein